MPNDYKPTKKKRKYTAHERRMYNQYARKAVSAGEKVEDMDQWLTRQEKEKQKGKN